MSPSVGQGEDVGSLTGRPGETSTQHRYYTRSSRDGSSNVTATKSPPSNSRYSPSNESKIQLRNQSHHNMRQMSLKRHPVPPPPTPDSSTTDSDETRDMDTTQSEFMMDQVTYSTSSPVRVPFPSPAMKTSQPFYPFPMPQQGTPLHEGWGPHHQDGVNGQCILVEAAKRAQMAILVDDMASMGFEQMEQT